MTISEQCSILFCCISKLSAWRVDLLLKLRFLLSALFCAALMNYLPLLQFSKCNQHSLNKRERFPMSTANDGGVSKPLSQGDPLPENYYWPLNERLVAERRAAREILRKYNATAFVSLPDETMAGIEARRVEMLKQLFGKLNHAYPPFIEPPFQCDYGYNIECGSHAYFNFGCVILDCAKVTIGNNCLFGPGVQIYCPGHPTDPILRNGVNGPEYGLPVSVGNDVWVGGNAIILPGVTVGDGAIVGAGAVVTKDVEPWTVVGGNPAKCLRKISKGDMGAGMRYRKAGN